jgi:hypothetical protein
MLINKFTIGADPEFAVLRDSQVVNVGDIEGPRLHSDHLGDVLEFTPAPVKSAFVLTKNINAILKEDDYIKHFDRTVKLVGGAVVKSNRRLVTLGGHIHFSDRTIWECPNKEEALDRTTRILETLDILPKEDSARRRRSGMGNGYGSWHDLRWSNDEKTIEYRTMCSWLHHPFAAFLCLTFGKLAVAQSKAILDNLIVKKASYQTLEKSLRLFNDADAQRAIEKLFEKKVDLTAKIDVDIRDSWKSISKLYRRASA